MQLSLPTRELALRADDLLRSSLPAPETALPPDRNIFENLPELPIINTVVSRENLVSYLEAFVPNDKGNIPQLVLEDLGTIVVSEPARIPIDQCDHM
jgi:hypothetical protein